MKPILQISVIALLTLALPCSGLLAATDASVAVTVKTSVCGNGVKEGGEQCDGSDIGSRPCSYLGYASGTISCTVGCEFDTATCTIDAQETAILIFTASLGGSYELSFDSRSLSVTLPPDFYYRDLRLQMFSFLSSLTANSKPAPAGKRFVGPTYELLFIDADGDIVPSLTKSVTVVMTHTASDSAGIDESSVRPYRWGASDTSWQPISGSVRDTNARTVTFTTSSFSSFALLGSPPQQSGSANEQITVETRGNTHSTRRVAPQTAPLYETISRIFFEVGLLRDTTSIFPGGTPSSSAASRNQRLRSRASSTSSETEMRAVRDDLPLAPSEEERWRAVLSLAILMVLSVLLGRFLL